MKRLFRQFGLRKVLTRELKHIDECSTTEILMLINEEDSLLQEL